MNCGSRGRWPFLGMTPAVLLLVLCLHLQGSASRCIDIALGQDLQPLPPGVQRCSIPSGLLQPDVSSLGGGGGGGGGGVNVGDTRVVGGMPATSGGLAGGSSTGLPSSPGNSPFQYGKPGNPSQGGPGPVGPVQYGDESYGGTSFGIRKNGPRGFPRPEWKAPGIPYIPTARERGGGYIPISKETPRYFPNAVPLGGGAGSSSSTYSGSSIASGPRGSDDGSYGPVPEGLQPGGQRGGASGERGPLCDPNC
ncbi:cuticle collagen 2-like [Elgaria multicarinata webbii]|uniref:cuticle collagen 2-like n=1 Tax=Elgaria multicarinata webbii TaxID=159646 RepID=UPI002FCD2BD4